jgi:hypothetical protein
MVELMVMHVATMYVVVVGQVWWFGVLSLMSLFATVTAQLGLVPRQCGITS